LWNRSRRIAVLPAEGTRQMGDENNWRRFEQLAMPRLDAAYNLALWITRNADDARRSAIARCSSSASLEELS